MSHIKHALASALIVLCAPAYSQDFGDTVVGGIVRQGTEQAEDLIDQASETFGKLLNPNNREFETEEVCLGELQLLVNAGAVVSNLMPFSNVWTTEANGVPAARFRILLNGEKLHVDVSCDGPTLNGNLLAWNEKVPDAEPYKIDTLDAALGAFLILSEQDGLERISTEEENVSIQQRVECPDQSVAGSAIGGPFTLISETGETVTDKDVITKPTLVYFGYTFCPDVCPLDIARNAQAAYILEEQGIDLGNVFISVDPQRDTVEVVRDFTDNFHEDMIGLTGTPEQVRAASQAYRTYYRANEGDPEYYLVDHSTFTYLMFPETGLATFFRRDSSAEEVAEVTACFIDAQSNR